ncbi:hypothetical protein MMC28_008209 [Mycoblastus sanguinarius]|nr:hypothetical protein [Mycoblastus sanguinarius]
MAPLQNLLGKKKLPPRANREDLESAHGSIPSSTASGCQLTPSRACLPSEQGTQSLMSLPTDALFPLQPSRGSSQTPASLACPFDTEKHASAMDALEANSLSRKMDTKETRTEVPDESIAETLDIDEWYDKSPVITQGQFSRPSTPVWSPIEGIHPHASISINEGFSETISADDDARIATPQGDELFEDMAAYEGEEEGDRYGRLGSLGSECTDPIDTSERIVPLCALMPNPSPTTLGQFAWSPCPSDDGQQVESAPPASTLQGMHPPMLLHNQQAAFGTLPDTAYSNSLSFPDSGNPPSSINAAETKLPHINLEIPASELHLLCNPDLVDPAYLSKQIGIGRSEDHTQVSTRWSGIISEGSSSRPMSQTELHQSVADFVKSLRERSQSDSSSRVDQHHGSAGTDVQPTMSQFDGAREPAKDGPGSSQTSSSLDADRSRGNVSADRGHLGFYEDRFSSSRIRSPTPPLLYGRRLLTQSSDSAPMSRPSLGRANSRLAKVVQTAGIRSDGRLARAMAGSADHEWESVSDMREGGGSATQEIATDAGTGSSLADNSDSGSLSLTKQTLSTPGLIDGRRILQHPPDPRRNHSFVLVKDNAGKTVHLPQYQFDGGSRLPELNARAHLALNTGANRKYRHPTPLSQQHMNPFTSSPPQICRLQASPLVEKDVGTQIHSKKWREHSTRTRVSKDAGKAEHLLDQSSSSKIGEDVSSAYGGHIEEGTCSKGQSSVWLSTTSEGKSGELSLPIRNGSFGKMAVIGRNGNLTGTPQGTGAREVGSSLADASSPDNKFSSSPAAFDSPPAVQYSPAVDGELGHGENHVADGFHNRMHSSSLQHSSSTYDDDLSVETDFDQHLSPEIRQHRQLLIHHHLLPRNQPPFLHPSEHQSAPNMLSIADAVSSSLIIPRVSGLEAPSAIATNKQSLQPVAYLPPAGLLERPSKSSTRRRRSSSESDGKAKASPAVQETSALFSSESNHGKKRNNTTGLLLRDTFSHSDDEDIKEGTQLPTSVIQRGRQPHVGDPSASTSAHDQSDYHNEVTQTNVPPPVLDHPVHGLAPSWSLVPTHACRPKDYFDQFARPVARTESPHLLRIPRRPSAEVFQRQQELSKMYLMVCAVLAPLCVVYGHGYLDGVMRWHTQGDVNGFGDREKVYALVWGYSVFATVVVGLVIAIIFIGT